MPRFYRLHGNDGPFVCPQCPALSFDNVNDVTAHWIEAHAPDTKFKGAKAKSKVREQQVSRQPSRFDTIKKQVEEGELTASRRLHFFDPSKNLKALPEEAYKHWDEELARH